MFKFKNLLGRTFKGKPRLDAPTPADRIAALAALPDDQQGPLVDALLGDADRGVRMAALARVTQLEALVSALADAEVAVPAAERLLTLIDEDTPGAIRDHPAVCCARLAHAVDVAEAEAAAAGIADANEHAAALLGNPHAEVRAAVAESSWDPAHLTALEKATRGRDKALNQLARERLRLAKNATAARDEEDARSVRILEAASALGDDDRHYDARRAVIERDWRVHLEAIAATDSALAPFGVVARDLDALKRRLPARRREPNVVKDAGADFEALLAEAETLCAAIAASLADEADAADLSTFKQTGDRLASVWNAAADATPPAADLSTRFHSSIAKANSLVDALQRHASLADEARDCLAGPVPQVKEADSIQPARRDIRRQSEALGDLLRRLAWSAELPASPIVAALDQRQSDLAAALERCAALEDDLVAQAAAGIAELRQHVEGGAVHIAVDLEQRLRETLKRLPHEPKVQPLLGELAEVGKQVRELRDWRAFAEAPKRQALCDQMQALAENPLGVREQAEAVKSLRQQWNDLGMANSRRERDLKKRFDSAAEKAFEPCRLHFKEQAERRQFNLEQRQAIVAALQKYVADNDWEQADWRGVDKVLRQARLEWRQYHPMDRKAGRALETRFEQLADDLHGRLKAEWDRNVALKEAIVAEAKAVRESSDQATAKAEAVKALQRRWKAVGPVPRRVDQRLWKNFRAECDIVFEKRNVVRDRHADRQRTIAAAESLIDELERRVDIDPALDRNTIADYERNLHDLGLLPKDLHRRAEAVLQHADRVVVDRQQAARGDAD